MTVGKLYHTWNDVLMRHVSVVCRKLNAQLPSVSTVQDIETNQSNKATFAVVTRSRPKNKTITKTKEATRSKSRAIRVVSKIKVA
jgi:hypothetical protein